MSDIKLARAATDRALKESSRDRGRISRPSTNEVECQFCGRYWVVFPKNGVSSVGFIISAAENHAFSCHVATPEERRAMARIAEKGWIRNPPANTISNDPKNPGFGGVDYRELIK